MAKDNVPFHSVVFPATLIGSQTEKYKWTMVKHLMATEYLNYEDAKFSKSRGIGVFGNDVANTEIPSDIWRFYLIYTRPENADSAFKWEDLMQKNNNELLANLGNFVNRALKFCKEYFGGKIAEIFMNEKDKAILVEVNKHLKAYLDAMEKCHLREAISETLSISKRGNQLMQSEKPWELVKSGKEEDRQRAGSVVSFCSNLTALIALLIEPFMPKLSSEILKQLNISLHEINVLKDQCVFKCVLQAGHVIGTPGPLIREIKENEMQKLKGRFAGTQKEREQKKKVKTTSKNEVKVNADIEKRLSECILSQDEVIKSLKASPASKENVDSAIDLILYLKNVQLEMNKGNF